VKAAELEGGGDSKVQSAIVVLFFKFFFKIVFAGQGNVRVGSSSRKLARTFGRGDFMRSR